MKRNTKLRRTQLDEFIKRLKTINLTRPKLGWTKEIRESLGMSMQDLANRSGTIKQRIERIEKDELTGKVTLETLQKTADALNCDLVYFFVPRTSLAATLEAQAQKVAEEIAGKVDRTMSLEDQKTSERAMKATIETLKERLLQESPKNLWRK